MKPDRLALVVGAVVLAAVMALSLHEGRRPAQVGGIVLPGDAWLEPAGAQLLACG